MKTETVNKNSWHYRLATTYGNASKYDLRTGEYDFCSYFWNCVLGAIFVIFLIFVLSFASLAFVLSPLIYVAAIFEIGLHAPPDDIAIVIAIEFAFLLGAGLAFAVNKGLPHKFMEQHFKNKNQIEDAPPSFATLAYRKFKEKTCIRLKAV